MQVGTMHQLQPGIADMDMAIDAVFPAETG